MPDLPSSREDAGNDPEYGKAVVDFAQAMQRNARNPRQYPRVPGFRALYDAANAFRDRAVAATLEEAAHTGALRSAMLPNDSDFTRGYAHGRLAAAAEIRALLPRTEKEGM